MKTCEPIKVSVAGLGRIGWRHAADIRKTEGLTLSSLCEPDMGLMEKAKAEFNIPVFNSYGEFLEKSDAGFIVIATPSHMHFDMASTALEKGFNVMVEKPVAPTAAQARKLKALAEKTGRWISVNQSFRYRPDVIYIKDIIKSGLVGDVYQFDVFEHGNVKERMDWQIWRKYDGGALANWGVHLVDAAMFMLEQEPSDVFAKLGRVIDKGDAEDVFKVVFRLGNGCVANAEVAKSFFKKPQWYICGSKGSIVGDFAPPPTMNLNVEYIANGKTETRTETIDFSQPPHTSQLLPHYAELVKNLNAGMRPPVLIDSVIRTMSVLDAARESGEKGSSVKVKNQG